MLTVRTRLAALICAFLVSLTSGCGEVAPTDPDVVAVVGGSAVTRSQVESLMPPTGHTAVRVGGEASAWQAAVDLAVRDELFAQEAGRRGIVDSSRAAQLAQLIEQERSSAPGITAAAVTTAEARAWHARHRAMFDELATADVAWATFSDQAAAEVAFLQAADDPAASVLELADRGGAERSGTARIAHDAGADPTVLRIAHAVRRAGGVGLDQDPGDLSWHLVRVEAVSFEHASWDAALATRVSTAMAWEAEGRHLAALADVLRERSPVTLVDQPR